MPDNKLTDVPENNVGKMSDNEIVNDVEQVTMALEYCVECDCEKCPYDELTAKAEAYKECIEKVKALFPSDNEPYQYWEIHEGADNLLKELVGESDG